MVTETADLIEQSLAVFEKEVSRIESKSDLLAAQEKCPELLDDAFKLLFLRTDLFDPELAALRYVLHWKNRVELFGSHKAFLPMTLTGAMQDDVQTLAQGYFRLVPGQERVILVDPSRKPSKYDADSIARCVWYMQYKALAQSEDMQKQGAIFVFDLGNTKGELSLDLTKRIRKALEDAFPLRFAKVCIINPPTVVYALYHVFKFFLKPKLRNRMQVVSSASTLANCGVDINGLSLVDHEEWVHNTMMLEDTSRQGSVQ